MIEQTILNHLVFTEVYARKVLPFLKEEYFHTTSDKVLFNIVSTYMQKYNSLPTKEAMRIELADVANLEEKVYAEASQKIDQLTGEDTNVEWLLDNTEKFCQDKAIYNAIMESISILDDTTGKLAKGSIPSLLQGALGVSFDTNIGHDYLADTEKQFEFYNTPEHKIPWHLDIFNKITKGGVSKKTLTVAMAGTGVGKSLFMCDCAASNLMEGKNVLYITLEMSEAFIAQRIDANLLDVEISDLEGLSRELYENKVSRIRARTVGKLIIKEYPTAAANVNHFRHLLQELKLKKNFIPDIIYVDYLNICSSARYKRATSNSYEYIKGVAEEIRGLAVEFALPVITATQTNRNGYGNTDVDLTDTSESFGLPMTADLMFALISSEELDQLGQIMVKQLKNRYNDPNYYMRFVIGVKKTNMRLYDLEESAQDDITGGGSDDDTPKKVSNNSKFKKMFQ